MRHFAGEWKELGRLIENDKKMKEFMRQKERCAPDLRETGRGFRSRATLFYVVLSIVLLELSAILL